MNDLTIAAAQSRSIKGDIAANAVLHSEFVVAAAGFGAQLVVFPELSLTGYEPDIARECAIAPEDARLDPLRRLARQHGMTVVAGAPILPATGLPHIAAFAFLPDGTVSVYTKRHLHPGEEACFQPGAGGAALHVAGETIALAICADTTHPEHAASAAAGGATIYAAGVLITEQGYAADARLLERYAFEHRMAVLMANHSSPSGRWTPAGRSAIWRPDGRLAIAAAGAEEALVIATRQDGRWRGNVHKL